MLLVADPHSEQPQVGHSWPCVSLDAAAGSLILSCGRPLLSCQAARPYLLREVTYGLQVSPLEQSLVWGALQDAEALLRPHLESMAAEWEEQGVWGVIPDLMEEAASAAVAGPQAQRADLHSIRCTAVCAGPATAACSACCQCVTVALPAQPAECPGSIGEEGQGRCSNHYHWFSGAS